MKMLRKENLLKVLLGSIVLILICGLIWRVFLQDDFDVISFRDRFNPFISETTSYAKVKDPGNTDSMYRNVQSINPKTGKNLPYKIKYIIKHDTGNYISIDHKGQYVKSINYISKKEFDSVKNTD